MSRILVCAALGALLLPGSATAAKLSKLSCDELVDIMVGADDDDDRADAAEVLGEKGCTGAIEALATTCVTDPDAEVCNTAVAALAEIGTPEALDKLVGILEDGSIVDGSRKKALNKLLDAEPTLADAAIPGVLGTYRKLDPPFTNRLIEALVKRDLRDAGDLTILIASDRTLKTKVRKKALEAADTLDHPLIHEAYLSLLDDSDKKLRIEACKGLGRTGLPSGTVAPALEQVVRSDEKGDVRAQALKSLKFHAHKGLLPLIHTEVMTEMHPIAWGHAVGLLIALADSSSVDTIHQVLLRDDNLPDEGVISLIHLLVRIGDPSSIHALRSLEARATGQVDSEAVIARKYLEGGGAEGAGSYTPPPTDVVIWDGSTPDDLPTLGVQLDANGIVIWVEE